MLQETDDNELVRLFKEHIDREKAFTTIVKRYQERIYWQIRRMVVRHEDADDVMQHVAPIIRVLDGNRNLAIRDNDTATYLEFSL